MKKRIMALALVLMMAMAVFTGCGSKNAKGEDLDYEAVVLTVGEHEITLREAYFMVKWWQADYQTIYANFMGEEWYNQSVDGTMTMEESLKQQVIDELTRTYLFLDHADEYGVALTEEDKAEIEDVVDEFMSSNSDEALAAMGATEDVVRNMLTINKEYQYMYNAIVETVDTTVTADEAKRTTYSYIYAPLAEYDEAGNWVDMSIDEQNSVYAVFEQIKLEIDNGTSFEDAATTYGYEVATHSFGSQDDGDYNDLNSLAAKLEVGETSDIIPVDDGVFILKLDTTDDKEAGETARDEIASEKVNDAFEALYEGYKEGVTIELDEELWATVNMQQPVAAYVGEE